ncbi:CocE/NonD family hydrolase [Lentzea kentuckyensis]|uniref:CocE/NonD family hydrolase n=1 Tax=Lentzea kentuckyensis TaxID=360086 RepID=UPI000A38B545|nr:CocE/NonD family hydrolase [Lentzea kentuckyensis]
MGRPHLTSRLLERLLELPPPLTRDVVVEKDLRVPMPDGGELLADRWAPRAGGDSLPIALIRTPYGRRGLPINLLTRTLAERGFQVVTQSARGTFGSGGTFEAFRNERADGLATLDWLAEQPWFTGAVVLTGASYTGYVQWAVADQLPEWVTAMIPTVTSATIPVDLVSALESALSWDISVAGQERRGALLRLLLNLPKIKRAMHVLPLRQADAAFLGHHRQFYQDTLAHDATDEHRADGDHRANAGRVTVPVSAVSGWYDLLLPGQLRDHQAVRETGQPARLTIGPWQHSSSGVTREQLKQTLEFGLSYARGEQPPPRPPVRLYVMGEEEWRDFESWPPPGYSPQRFHLQPGGELSRDQPVESTVDRYRYDPADPTPAVGGPRLFSGAGKVDNAKLEARPDVLTYTTSVLESDVEVIGEVSAEIWFRSSLRHADVFVRLCDVDSRGRSFNICDGFISATNADELRLVTVSLWPTAHVFKRGHRIRVQVSSGAFPLYGRNPGTGEPRADAVTLLTADQEVFHGADHPSAVILPVRQKVC